MAAKKITILLEAGTAAFISGVDKAAAAVKHMGQKSGEARGMMDKLKEGFAAGMGMEAVHKALELAKEGLEEIKHAMEEVGQIGRGAQMLGISAEQMSRFTHAANAAHVPVEALSTGMDHLNRQIGLAASGDKSAAGAAKAFAKLGLSMSELQSLAPDAAFQRVSEALGHVGSTYERAAISQQIFGRGGKALIPLMGELSGLMQESDDIGFTRTAENIEAAEKEERELARMTDTVKGLFMDLATSDWAQKLVSEIASTVSAIREMPQALGDTLLAISTLGASTALETGHVADLTDAVAATSNRFEEMKGKIVEAQRALASAHGLDERVAATRELVSAMKEALPLQVKLRGEQAQQGHTDISFGDMSKAHDTLDAQKQVLATLQKQKEMQDKAAAAAKTAAKESEKLQQGLAKQWDEMQKSVATFGMTAAQKKTAEFAAQVHALGNQKLEGTIGQFAAMARHLDAMAESAKRLKTATDELARLKQQAEGLGKTSADKSLEKIEHSALSAADKAAAAGYQKSIAAFEAHKKQIEEAHALLEKLATPLQKYQEELKKISELEKAGALTHAQAQQAAAAAKAHLPHAHAAAALDLTREASMISRRFSFDLPSAAKTGDGKLLDLAKQADSRQQQWHTWFQAIWQTITAPGGASGDTAATI